MVKINRPNNDSDSGVFVCLKPECNLEEMSQEEREALDKGIKELIDYGKKLLEDDSLWKN